jgi:hypothetical protein
MSDSVNPYQSPENVSVPEKPLAPQAALTDVMLRYLKEASPWLRFIGILGYISSGFLVFGGLIFTVVILVRSGIAEDIGGFPIGIAGLFYAAVGVVIFFPARFACRFGSSIRNYFMGGAEGDLETAFKNNKSLWKFYGILSIINFAFIPLAVIIGIIGGIAALINSL